MSVVWIAKFTSHYGPLFDRGGPLRIDGVVEVIHGVVEVTVMAAENVDLAP